MLVAGDRRASPEKLKRLLKARRVIIADADRVREATGFSIGGVAPVGHRQPLPVWIDASLSRFETVHAAAGHHQAVFPIAYRALVRITDGKVADLTETPREGTS